MKRANNYFMKIYIFKVVRAKERLDAELDGINRKQQQREKNAEGSAEECGERSKQN